jgi:flagellar basal body L-ring protein FlgH
MDADAAERTEALEREIAQTIHDILENGLTIRGSRPQLLMNPESPNFIPIPFPIYFFPKG